MCALPADRSASSQGAASAADAQWKIEAARSRRAQEQQSQEEARRSLLCPLHWQHACPRLIRPQTLNIEACLSITAPQKRSEEEDLGRAPRVVSARLAGPTWKISALQRLVQPVIQCHVIAVWASRAWMSAVVSMPRLYPDGCSYVQALHQILSMCRRAHEEHRCRAAHVAAQRNQSKPSWAEQAAAQLALAELAGDGAYQGSWTFMGSSGQEMGPYTKSELIALHDRCAPTCSAGDSDCTSFTSVPAEAHHALPKVKVHTRHAT